jgi:hypothetical protein
LRIFLKYVFRSKLFVKRIRKPKPKKSVEITNELLEGVGSELIQTLRNKDPIILIISTNCFQVKENAIFIDKQNKLILSTANNTKAMAEAFSKFPELPQERLIY